MPATVRVCARFARASFLSGHLYLKPVIAIVTARVPPLRGRCRPSCTRESSCREREAVRHEKHRIGFAERFRNGNAEFGREDQRTRFLELRLVVKPRALFADRVHRLVGRGEDLRIERVRVTDGLDVGRRRRISEWIGHSWWRLPLPSSTLPSKSTRSISSAPRTSSMPMWLRFIQRPRPSGSRHDT